MIFAGSYFLLNAYFLSAIVTICVRFHSFRVQYEIILGKLAGTKRTDVDGNEKIKSVLTEAIRFQILVKE